MRVLLFTKAKLVVNDENLGEHLKKSKLLPTLATVPAGTVVLSETNLTPVHFWSEYGDRSVTASVRL